MLPQIETIAGHIDCDHFHGEFSCKIVNSITSWLVIFVHLSVIGTAFVVLGSAGNSVYARADLVSTGYLIIGVASILFSCVLPYFFPMSTFFFNTYTEPGEPFLSRTCFYGHWRNLTETLLYYSYRSGRQVSQHSCGCAWIGSFGLSIQNSSLHRHTT